MKYIYLFISCLLISNITNAQIGKHEFSLYGAGGMSTLSYEPEGNGSRSGGFGGSFGVGYMYSLNNKWGIVTGVELSLYNSKVKYGALTEKYSAVDGKGDSFEFSYRAENYEEKQKVTSFAIPIMVQYSLPISGNEAVRFFASGGFKFSFPINATAAIKPGTITSTGYYSYENQLYENLPSYGFVNAQSGKETDEDIELGLSTILSLETGVRLALGKGNSGIYAGLYFEYGLNNAQKNEDKHILQYQPANPSVFKYGSLLESSMVDKVNVMSIGVKARFAFGSKQKVLQLED